jgi:SusD family.
MIKRIIKFAALALLFASCENQFSPIDDNHRTLEDVTADVNYAEGVLLVGYTQLPTNSYSFSEVATDDAVSNYSDNAFRKIATGQWTSMNNPLSKWDNSYSAILYMNKFLTLVDKVNWGGSDTAATKYFVKRMKGEAYGLRARYMLDLLQAHAGYVDGVLMGVPIITEDMGKNSDFNKPRASFDECMDSLYSDLKKAEELLPVDYVELKSLSLIPAKYSGATLEQYNRVFGKAFRGRLTGRIAKAIRAKAALLAASPAFNPTGAPNYQAKWEYAANSAAEVIDLLGGTSGLDSRGLDFYSSSNISKINYLTNVDIAEVLWRGDISNYPTGIESEAYPPSLYGNGRVNPSQNLVDAFPNANGYPITDLSSSVKYDSLKPFTNRDPRLKKYIVYNGNTLVSKVINIQSGKDAVDSIAEKSTRTGYYLKKLMNESVNLDPAFSAVGYHYSAHIRYTEIFLIYAEAANEAWGPLVAAPGHTYTAYDVIKAIRDRALGTGKDKYLTTVKSDPLKMQALIRNERRLELCFEGFRFWDLRRWKHDLTEAARGMRYVGKLIKRGAVESRLFNDSHYYFGPLPYYDVLKESNLKQNDGWNN